MKVLKYKYNPNKKGVFRVSIVKNPAVGEGDLVLMSAQEIKGVFYAPVMIPDLKIQRIDDNGNKYMVYYDAETVEQLANNYFKQNGNSNTNIEHSEDDVEGVYPIESWIVKDPENDKSKALGMPAQKEGTWIMGYKCDSPEILKQIQDKLLQGLSIEGHLDTEEDTDSPITKFNKHFMKKTPLEFAKHLANVIMAAVSDEEKPVECTAETPVEDEKPIEDENPVEEMAVEEVPTEEMPTEPTDTEKELATAKATIVELESKVAELEAELATYKNDATLMSAQLEDVNKAFESYKAVKMSSQKLGDTPKIEITMSALEKKQAKFLEDVRSKI